MPNLPLQNSANIINAPSQPIRHSYSLSTICAVFAMAGIILADNLTDITFLMMILGMALYKTGVLQAARSRAFYIRLTIAGFGLGLIVNAYEAYRALSSAFAVMSTFAQMQPTYHFGRLSVAVGYIGLLCLICRSDVLQAFTTRLALVGRMALTNYLMQSLICAVIFTGLGFGLLGDWQRIELYGVVIAIWAFQIWLSAFWLQRYRLGPLEWVWRALTYGSAPSIKRAL